MDDLPNFYQSTCKKCDLEIIDMVRLDLNACPKCGSLDWTPHVILKFHEVPESVLKRKFRKDIDIYGDANGDDQC